MNLHLRGKLLFVTGGTSGIGAVRYELITAEEGIAVIVDRNVLRGKSKSFL